MRRSPDEGQPPDDRTRSLVAAMEAHGLTQAEQRQLYEEGVVDVHIFASLRDADFEASGIDIKARRRDKGGTALESHTELEQVQQLLDEVGLSAQGREAARHIHTLHAMRQLDLTAMAKLGLKLVDRRKLEKFCQSDRVQTARGPVHKLKIIIGPALMVIGGVVQQIGVWADSPFREGSDSNDVAKWEDWLAVSGETVLAIGALCFLFGIDHDTRGGPTGSDGRGNWSSLKTICLDEGCGTMVCMAVGLLVALALFPLAWCGWVVIIAADERLGDGEGGTLFWFLWGVACSLASTAWTCSLDWAPWIPAIAALAALLVILFEAAKEAEVLCR